MQSSALAEKYDRYSDSHQKNAKPSPQTDSFMQEDDSSQCPGNVAQCSHRNDKANVVQRQSAEKCEESQCHHAKPSPHPGLIERSPDNLDDLNRMKAGCLANALHRARHTEFTSGSRRHDHCKQNEVSQFNLAPLIRDWSSAVRYGLRRTRPGR